ncbi:helix-turn-helix domain-containing protein [Pseudomonas sp. SG20056]|uniref:helix-turn-helix domain-containing protein n=1 Tax=Pseudomonas sp. SG20056 TaxID=3074146 RepID=UPI00287F4BB2|nr:helix-turn-helix domain-containing protein [Pseudomonas sp. SG20056]WNF47370.1 helix-turn-helix domain-containing protein [Pseudomonas sp. SG20056]
MSIKAMNWAWEQPLPPVPKLILMALADNADDHGYCWPKMKTIAAKCSTSERTIQRTIKTLLTAGMLKKDARFDANGRQVSNGYTLVLSYPDKLSPPAEDRAREGDTHVTPGVTQLCRGEGDKAMSPLEPPYEPSYESSVQRTAQLTQLNAAEKQKVSQLIRSIPADQQEAITAQLLNALTKGAIRSSPSRWLKAVIHRTGRVRHPQNASQRSEADYVERLIQGGISTEDAQHIAQQTFSRRIVSRAGHRKCPLSTQQADNSVWLKGFAKID